ncbi:lysozyme [Flavobacterium sp.]|jgi:lysozyme|uniref:lysozyme n=1 Tax=Flavobacterium sp. TaxID=239 RepID=UPI0037C0256C
MGTQSEGWLKQFISGFNSYSDKPEPVVKQNPIEVAKTVAADLCKKYEGLRLKPYICPAGYPTIGYGTVYKPDGVAVKMSDPAITEAQAEEWLLLTISRDYLPAVLNVSPALIKYPRTLGAITSFVYNLGIARYRASTLKRKLNEGDFSAAKVEILKWDKARVKGVMTRLKGLTARRISEASYIGT